MPTDDVFSLLQLRTALGLPQSEMARRMGLSLRPYQELESKVRAVRSRHIRLAELVALDVAVENDYPELAPWDIRRKAIKLAIAVLMNNLRQK
jgi:transcriptional regulator with XRE-family HTH domain